MALGASSRADRKRGASARWARERTHAVGCTSCKYVMVPWGPVLTGAGKTDGGDARSALRFRRDQGGVDLVELQSIRWIQANLGNN
ncbi:hypothetical protein GCM10023339_63850 [Alloalcanivorax gelatiniphagus]